MLSQARDGPFDTDACFTFAKQCGSAQCSGARVK